MAIFFGSQECYACRMDSVPERVRVIVDSLRLDASSRQISFSAIGVEIHGEPMEGVKWLQKYGSFDEVAAGGDWYNTIVQRYLWSDPAATPGLPQIVLLRQHVVADRSRILVDSERVVHRWLGAIAISPALGDQKASAEK